MSASPLSMKGSCERQSKRAQEKDSGAHKGGRKMGPRTRGKENNRHISAGGKDLSAGVSQEKKIEQPEREGKYDCFTGQSGQ